MSDGYQVLMGDLLGMSQTFDQESTVLNGAVSGGGVTAPDGGDGMINSALANALQTAGLATGQLGAVVGNHGQKLLTAYQKYQGAEQDSTQLCQKLTGLI